MKSNQNEVQKQDSKQSFRALKSTLTSSVMVLLLLATSCSDEELADQFKVTTIANSISSDQFKVTTIADFKGTSGKFVALNGIARDAQGNLFVTDGDNNRISKITPDGTVSTFAGTGMLGFADGTGTSAMFQWPKGIVIDKQDNLYVADGGNNRIRKITPDGVVSTFAGSGEKGFEDGPASLAKFSGPSQIALDIRGNLYVTDMNNYRIRKITPEGIVSTLAGSGIRGYENGSGTDAQFMWLSGIVADAQGNIYVGDFYRIRKISPEGVVSSFSGIPEPSEVVNGDISVARFRNPAGFAIDCLGNIYVADYGYVNGHIRKITPEGMVSTLVKKYDSDSGGGDKTMHPWGITMDASNTIYITDLLKQSISKIESTQALPVCNDTQK